MEKLYQHQAYMVEGMYVVGVNAKSLGEGVVPVVYSREYTMAYLYWSQHPGHDYGIYRWAQGTLLHVGRKMIDKKGRPRWVPIPPWNMVISA
jgi:hypothetical protein